jgi:alpha-galactosidase
MAFHNLVATSVLTEDREAAVHALMIDPLTAAVCSPNEIRAMFDEMVAAEAGYLPDYLVL